MISAWTQVTLPHIRLDLVTSCEVDSNASRWLASYPLVSRLFVTILFAQPLCSCFLCSGNAILTRRTTQHWFCLSLSAQKLAASSRVNEAALRARFRHLFFLSRVTTSNLLTLPIGSVNDYWSCDVTVVIIIVKLNFYTTCKYTCVHVIAIQQLSTMWFLCTFCGVELIVIEV